MIKYTDNQVIEWYEEYKKHNSIYPVSKIFGVSSSTIWRRLKEYEDKNRLKSISTSKYSINDSFFSKDSDCSFYWAGFISADGNVRYMKNRKTPRLSIGLKRSDETLLYKLKDCLSYSGPVHRKEDFVGRGGRISYIQIHNLNIVKDLERFNVFPKKTKTYKFPNWLLTHNLVNHFIRGYFDGDGCIHISKKNCPYFTITGQKDFLKECQKVLIKNCNLKENKIHKNGNVFALNYAGKENVKKIKSFLYKKAYKDIFLERKFSKFKSVGL